MVRLLMAQRREKFVPVGSDLIYRYSWRTTIYHIMGWGILYSSLSFPIVDQDCFHFQTGLGIGLGAAIESLDGMECQSKGKVQPEIGIIESSSSLRLVPGIPLVGVANSSVRSI